MPRIYGVATLPRVKKGAICFLSRERNKKIVFGLSAVGGHYFSICFFVSCVTIEMIPAISVLVLSSKPLSL